MKAAKYIDWILYLSWFIFFFSLLCNFRGYSSIAIGGMVIAGVLHSKTAGGNYFSPALRNYFLLSCCIFYFLQAGLLLSYPYTISIGKELQLKSGIILVPLAVCCGNYLDNKVFTLLMRLFTWTTAAVLLFCLLIACYHCFIEGQPATVFLYHALVSPVDQHAVQVSILLFICIVYLLQSTRKGPFERNRFIHFILVLFFTGMIILLSSKLVIIFTILVFTYYLFIMLRSSLRWLAVAVSFICLAAILAVLATSNPVSQRFREVMHTNLSLVERPVFNAGVYFDGIQFRLLQVRFVKEILNENHAWAKGVSHNAQSLLNNKYSTTHMYLGDGKGDPGYARYNTHNQFLESLLQSGIPGLLAYILMVITMLWLLVRGRDILLSFTILLLIAYSFNESVLERQNSMMMFTFFPLFIYYGRKNEGIPPANSVGKR